MLVHLGSEPVQALASRVSSQKASSPRWFCWAKAISCWASEIPNTSEAVSFWPSIGVTPTMA